LELLEEFIDFTSEVVAKHPKIIQMLLSIVAASNSYILEHRVLVTNPFYVTNVLHHVKLSLEKKFTFVKVLNKFRLLVNSWASVAIQDLDCVHGVAHLDILLPHMVYQTSIENEGYRYKLQSSLGKGGHGEAFAVENISTHKKCALKRLNVLHYSAHACASAFEAEENAVEVDSPWVLKPSIKWFDKGCIHVRCHHLRV
jgi:hypothetical protein